MHTLRVVGAVSAVVLFGCAGAADPPAAPVGTTSAVVAAKVAAQPRELPRRAPTFTDDQILALLGTYNTGEVELATIAHERAKDPRVRSFADGLAEDHRAALHRELALREHLVARAPTEQMRQMERAAAEEATKLKSLEGHELDVEFVTHEVGSQRDALALLDVQLIPSAHRADVRAHLADLRGEVDRHLRDAKALERAIGGPVVARR